jgi:hypothetical protein
MANKDVLAAFNWDPGCYFGRSFTSMTSANNAAVDIRWDPTALPNAASNTITFYLSLSTGEQPPAVVAFYPPTASFDVRDVSQPTVAAAGTVSTGLVSPPAPSYDIQPRSDTMPTAPVYDAYPYTTPQYYQSAQGYSYQPATPQTTAPNAYSAVPNTYPTAPAYSTAPAAQGAYSATPAPQGIYQLPQAVPQAYSYQSAPTAVQSYTYPIQPPVDTVNKPFDMDYALDLFDRIQRLSSGQGGINGINREEIARLNAELDAVLNSVRKK